MIQKLRFISSQDSGTYEFSINSSQSSTNHLISKILQLQTQLYQVNIENQDLRQKKGLLESSLKKKRAILANSSFQQNCMQQQKKKHIRNLSQPTHFKINAQSDPIIPLKSTALLSVQPGHFKPVTGKQANFSKLKQTQSEVSINSGGLYNLSSPRTTGIRKNKKIPKSNENEESAEIGFKSIEQIWNRMGKGQTFLKKTSDKLTHKKKKSYLN